MPPEIRKYLAFGTGVGIQIRGADLEVAVARVRPSSIHVLGRATIRGFRERPAAEWGAEYLAFLKTVGAAHLSATVLLPRQEVIVRPLALPGVSSRDLDAAVSFQRDTLHPYGEDEAASGWSLLGPGSVLVAISRRPILERYIEMFEEAGVALASFTCSAAAIHAALRLLAPAPAAGLLAVVRHEEGSAELYGESPARAIFSAEFDLPLARAAAAAASELRLPDAQPAPLGALLPQPRANPIENDLSRNALPYAAALAGACPRLAPAANLLPPARRKSNSRVMLAPTAALAALLLLIGGASLAYSAFENRRYLSALEDQIARLEPRAQRAAALDREIDRQRARARLLDEFRGRTRADLDALNEITRLLPPPIWTNVVDLSRDSAIINGEAEQAAPLVKTLDASPLFTNSELSMVTPTGKTEAFRIRTQREARP